MLPLALGLNLVLFAAAPSGTGSLLATARAAYASLEFERCLRALDLEARRVSAGKELATVALWRGLCSAGLNDLQGAVESFRLARELEPGISLPPLTAPKVASLFEAAAPRASDAPVKARPLEPSQPSLPIAVVKVPLSPSLHPSGAFYLPAGAAVLAGGLAVLFGVQARGFERSANAAPFADDAEGLGTRARSAALASNLCTGGAVLAAVGAVVSLALSPRGTTP